MVFLLNEMKKIILKVGVIGLGGIANNHLFCLSLIENKSKIWGKFHRVKIWALCDIDSNILEERRKIFKANTYSTDPYDLINNPEIDVIYVLTPTKFHKEYVIAAANKGKHVFVEKPTALLPEDIDEMIEARNKNNVKIQVGLVMRSAPIIEYLKNYLIKNAKKLGKPLNFSFRDSQWKPYIGDKEAHGGSTWRKDKNSAHGGVLFEHVIHDIDAMSYLFGIPDETYAKIRYIAGNEGIEDSVAVIMSFPNGMVMNITATWNDIHFDQRRLEIYYENAYIWITVEGGEIHLKIKYLGEDEQEIDLEQCEVFYKKLIGKPQLKSEIPGPYYYESIRFFDSIFNNLDAYPSLEIGKRAQQIIECCYESSRLNKPIKIELKNKE